jgi:hypothetical protein
VRRDVDGAYIGTMKRHVHSSNTCGQTLLSPLIRCARAVTPAPPGSSTTHKMEAHEAPGPAAAA